MKKIKTLFAVGFLAVLTSCGTTKDVATKDSTAIKQESNRGRSNQGDTSGRTKTTNSPQMSSEKTADSTDTVENNDALDTARLQEMYSSLNMDENQIKRFESDWGRSTSVWKRSNRNKSMNNFEKVEYQDRILKNILDESQFEAYQEWARENPMTD